MKYRLVNEFGILWGAVEELAAALEACRVHGLSIRW